MAKHPMRTSGGESRSKSDRPWHRRYWKTILWSGLAALAIYLLASYLLVRELPTLTQRLWGLGFALLAVATFVWGTRTDEDPEALLQRLRGAPQPEFGRQLRAGKTSRVRAMAMPKIEGKTRILCGVLVGAMAVAWWWTPWAPVRAKPPEMADLTAIFEDDLVAGVLVLGDADTAVLQPPVIPALARQAAGRIRDNAEAIQLALRAVAQGQFDEARSRLDGLDANDFLVQLTRAQAEMYAGRFGDAAKAYENVLNLKSDQPGLLCQAAMAYLHGGDSAKAESLARNAEKQVPASAPARPAVLHVQCLLAAAGAKDLSAPIKRMEQERKECIEILGDDHPLLAAGLNNQAVLYVLQASRTSYTGAPELFQWAERLYDQDREKETLSKAFRSQDVRLAAVLLNRAAMHYALAEYSKAGELLQTAGTMLEAGLPGEHPFRAVELNLGSLLARARGDTKTARSLAEQAEVIVQKSVGGEHALMVPILDALAAVRVDGAQYAQADEACRRRVRLAEKLWGRDQFSPWIVDGLTMQAAVYTLQARQSEADTCCKQAVNMAEKTLGKQHPGLAAAQRACGRLEMAKGNSPEARRNLGKAQGLFEAVYGKEQHPEVARTLGDLASLDNSASTCGRGVIAYQRAISMLEKSCGPEHPDLARLLCGVATLYQIQEKWDDATASLKRALDIQRKWLAPNHPDLATTLRNCASVLRQRTPANPNRAAEMEAEAQGILRKHAEQEQADLKKGR